MLSEAAYTTKRGAIKRDSTYKSEDTPPLTSVRNFSRHHYFTTTRPPLHHYCRGAMEELFFILLKSIL